MKELKEVVVDVVKEVAPEWTENEDFILNVETLYEQEYVDNYEDDEEAEMIDGFCKDAIVDAINASINDYEEGLTDF